MLDSRRRPAHLGGEVSHPTSTLFRSPQVSSGPRLRDMLADSTYLTIPAIRGSLMPFCCVRFSFPPFESEESPPRTKAQREKRVQERYQRSLSKQLSHKSNLQD